MAVSNSHRLYKLHPAFLLRVWAFLGRLAEHGVPNVRILFGYRSLEEQARLRKAWKEGTGGKANAPGLSWHNYGFAMDALPYEDKDHDRILDTNEVNWNTPLWDSYGDVAISMGLTWGGVFGNVDKPHVEWHPGFSPRIKPSQLVTLRYIYEHEHDHYGRWARLPLPGDG